MIEYCGYYIEFHESGFIVCYCGDEIYFDTEKEAANFIDEINGRNNK